MKFLVSFILIVIYTSQLSASISPDSINILTIRTSLDTKAHFRGKMKFASDDANASLINKTGDVYTVLAETGKPVARATQITETLYPGIEYTFQVWYPSSTIGKEPQGPKRIMFDTMVVWERPEAFLVKEHNGFVFSFIPSYEIKPWVWFWHASVEDSPYGKTYYGSSDWLIVSCKLFKETTEHRNYPVQNLPRYIWNSSVVFPETEVYDSGNTSIVFEPFSAGIGNLESKPILGTELLENRFNPDVYTYLTSRGISGIYVQSRRDHHNYDFIDPDYPTETKSSGEVEEEETPSEKFASTISALSASGKLNSLLIKNNPLQRDYYDSENQVQIANYFNRYCKNTRQYYLQPELTGQENALYRKFEAESSLTFPSPRLYSYLDDWVTQMTTFNDSLKNKVGPDSIKLIHNSNMAAFPFSWCYQSGIDALMAKTIKRQNVQIVMANARGHAKANNAKCFMRLDAWGSSHLSWWRNEMSRVYKDFYYGGADYIDHESGEAIVVIDSSIYVNEKGISLLDFSKWMNEHPGRGKLNIPIAVMQGRGSISGRMTFEGWGNFSGDLAIQRARYDKDLNYLDVFFSDYGNCYETNWDRLFTGTPYGQVDLIPFDASADILNNYRFILIAGLNAMTLNQAAELRQFVEFGGTLMLSLGSALGDEIYNDRTFKGEQLFSGTGLNLINNAKPLIIHSDKNIIKYQMQLGKGKVIEKWDNNEPCIVEHSVGKGKIVLIAAEALNHIEDENVNLRAHIRNYASYHATISTFETQTWLETFLQKHDSVRHTLALFNHGNLEGVPDALSGNPYDSWSGQLTIDTLNAEITTSNLKMWISYPEKLRGNEVPYSLVGGKLHIDVSLSQFQEIIISNKRWSDIEQEFSYTSLDISDKNQNTLNIYPNPIRKNDVLRISVNDKDAMNTSNLEVYNMSGSLIIRSDFSTENYNLNTTELDPGIYTIVIRAKSNVYIEKLIVQ